MWCNTQAVAASEGMLTSDVEECVNDLAEAAPAASKADTLKAASSLLSC